MSTRQTILVIGDDEVFAELLGRMPKTRCAVAFAADVDEGWAQIGAHHPQVVVAVLDDGPPPDELLTRAREHGARCIGLTRTGFDPPGAALCEEVFAANETERIVEAAASRLPVAAAPAAQPDPALGERLKDLEKRVSEIALGTTGGLSELLQATDGLAQGLKLHARMLRELEQRVESGESAGDDDDADEEELDKRLAWVTERLESLEGRVGEVAVGATGGLSELLQATDGLGQGLKAQARALSELERRLQEVSTQHTDWQANLDAAREARSRAPDDQASLEQRLDALAERLEGLEARLGEVAVGITGGLSELLQATDGLGQGLKEQSRVIAELERKLREARSESELARQALEERIEALEQPGSGD